MYRSILITITAAVAATLAGDLNGPPPGAQITVTVGGATCTTSD